MRTIELILLIVQACWLLSLFQTPFRKWQKTIVFADLVFLGFHFLLEGFRWQMVLVYAVSIIMVLAMVYSSLFPVQKKKAGYVKRSKTASALIGMFGGLYLALTAAVLIVAPVFDIPEPTGSESVAMASYHLVDEKRDETFLPSAQNREVMVSIWYPAVEDEQAEFLAYPYKELGGALGVNYNLPSFLFDYMKYVQTNTMADAAVSDQHASYPVLLFSHGFTGTRMQNFTQMEELASHGYIIVSIDHTYDSGYTEFPDGRKIGSAFSPEEFVEIDHEANIDIRAKDASFVLDELYKLNEEKGIFTGKMDLTRVGIFGHSYGGATSAKVIESDSRFKAGLNMDGTLYGSDVNQEMKQPFMNIIAQHSFTYTPSDSELDMMNQTLEEYKQEREKEWDKINTLFERGEKQGSYKLTMFAGDHMSFSDTPYLTPLMERGFKVKENHQVVNLYVRAFFDQYVKEAEQEFLQKEYKNHLYQLEIAGNTNTAAN